MRIVHNIEVKLSGYLLIVLLINICEGFIIGTGMFVDRYAESDAVGRAGGITELCAVCRSVGGRNNCYNGSVVLL